jgi:hypothetical protein
MKRHHCLTSLQMALTALTAVVATVSLSRRVTGRAMLLAMPLCALVLTLTPLQGFADYWTTFTSEEYTPIECQPGDLVSGWYCTGSYCDASYLRCAETHYGLSQRSWTPYISEEGGPRAICPNDGFMTGLACRGSYCDDISIQCTTTVGHGRGACYWTGDYNLPTYSWAGWLSEERGAWYAEPGYYIAGVQCRGSNCDDKQFYMCYAQ